VPPDLDRPDGATHAQDRNTRRSVNPMTSSDIPAADYARNMKLIGRSDIGGRGDALQLMVHRRYAYIGHPWSRGFWSSPACVQEYELRPRSAF